MQTYNTKIPPIFKTLLIFNKNIFLIIYPYFLVTTLVLTILAGLPARITPHSGNLVTRVPAATIVLSPCITPGKIKVSEPIRHLLPMNTSS